MTELTQAVQALLQGIALDRAYQIASPYTCDGCGLPAVRIFRGYAGCDFNACPSCVPPIEYGKHNATRIVKTIGELQGIKASILDESSCPTVFVETVERVFELVFVQPTLEPDGVTLVPSFTHERAWDRVIELRERPPLDHPRRKAIERLMRVAEPHR